MCNISLELSKHLWAEINHLTAKKADGSCFYENVVIYQISWFDSGIEMKLQSASEVAGGRVWKAALSHQHLNFKIIWK